MSDTNTDAEKLLKIAVQNRKRASTFYNLHKQEILLRKLVEREEIKNNKQPPTPPVVKKSEYTLDEIIEVFKNTITKENTLRKYISDVKRVFKLSGITSFTGTLLEYVKIKEAVQMSKYSLSTIKGSFQAILVFITNSKMDICETIVSNYDKIHKVAKIKCEDQVAQRITELDLAVIPFTEYHTKIREHFGVDSKEYVIASIYKEVTCRDDLASLKIVRNVAYDNGVCNTIFIDPHRKVGHIVLNKYKTSNIYGKYFKSMSPELFAIIINYIQRNNLAGYLFPDEYETGLSKFIIEMNKKIDIDQGINGIRHMIISEFLKRTDLTPEIRYKFSCDCFHSESMQQQYRRGLLDENLKMLCDK